MAVKFTNNAATTLAAGINSSVTSISVTDGSVFPALTGSDHFYVTFDDTTNREIVKVTARSGNTLTVVRGQDNTTAQAFNSGDKAELRVVAALLEDITTEVTSTLSVDTFTGDGTTTAFTLSQAPSSEDNLIVFIEGAYQNPGDFVLSGTTLTLDEAPVVDRNIIVYHVKGAVSGNNLNQDSFTADGNTAAFTLSIAPIHENNTQVFIDGVYQQKNSYSISGTTLTLDANPSNGATVEVMTFTQTEVNTLPASFVSGLTEVTAVGADHFMIFDATDSALKKSLVSDVLESATSISTSADATAITIDSSENVTFTNNVTINSGQLTAGGLAYPTSDGTNGQVLTTDGSGTLSFSTISGYTDSDVETYLNTSEIYTDATNNRLGIGAASPTEKLSVLGGHISVGDSTGVAGTEFLLEGYRELYLGAKYGNTSIRTTYDIGSNASDMLFYTASGGTNTEERMRITSGGGVVVNGTTTSGTFSVYGGGGIELALNTTSTVATIQSYSSKPLALNALGNNVGIGTNNPSVKLDVNAGAENVPAKFTSTDAGSYIQFMDNNATGHYLGTVGGSLAILNTSNVERMRITSSGYTKYTTVGAFVNLSGTYHETIGSDASIAYYIYNTNSGGDCLFLNCNNENSSNFFLAGYSDNAGRHNIYIYSNGNVVNRNNSYGSLSDQKLKQDIEDANSQWEDIKAIQFRKYRWKQDVASNADAPYQLGVIAQELESAGMHGLVEETDDKEFYDEVVLDENGNPVLDENGNNVTQREERLTGESTKSVKYSILTLKAIKALQEAMERIETLEAKITTLENA